MITIKTRFDETTIGRNRGDGLLYPNSRLVSIKDDNGTQYFPSAIAQSVLEKSQTAGRGDHSAAPRRKVLDHVVFDLPADIQNPTLLIREGELVTHFVIGHENSPLHKKTRFQLYLQIRIEAT